MILTKRQNNFLNDLYKEYSMFAPDLEHEADLVVICDAINKNLCLPEAALFAAFLSEFYWDSSFSTGGLPSKDLVITKYLEIKDNIPEKINIIFQVQYSYDYICFWTGFQEAYIDLQTKKLVYTSWSEEGEDQESNEKFYNEGKGVYHW